MKLTDDQTRMARGWLNDGMKLSEFQKRLETDFGMKLTYMEVRFLVDDLKVQLVDPEPVVEDVKPIEGQTDESPAVPDSTLGAPTDGLPGSVSVSVDSVTQPGTMVSGQVTFTDGQKARWYVDSYGRPGLAPETPGYRPSREDIEQFQMTLDRELTRRGL